MEYVCEFAAGLELELALVWAFVALIYFLGRVIYICNKNRPNGRVVGYSLVGSVDFGLMVYALKSFFFLIYFFRTTLYIYIYIYIYTAHF